MTAERRLLLMTGLAALALAAWLGLTAALVMLTLEPADRSLVQQLLAPRWALALMSWVFAVMVVAGLIRRHLMPAMATPARIADQARALVSTEGAPPVAASGPKAIRDLAQAINELAGQRDELRRNMAERVQEASRSIQQERNRLAALMSELTQSVVVCNLDGRIVLYNNRARLQFRALSQAPTLADGAELIGIGRSIYGVFDRQLVAHALESIHLRMARGAGNPSAQFVTTTRSGQLLRAQMAPVRASDAAAGEPALSGFVLMLDNVTRSFQEEHQRDQLMHGLTERSRSSLASMQTAVDMLALPDLEPDMRERFLGIVGDEVSAMSRRIADLAHTTTQGLKTRWPLEEMLGSDLLLAAQRRIEAVTGRSAPTAEVDASVWLHVDSYSLIQALTYLSARLVEEI